MERLIDMAQWDESPLVRATAVSALGRYVLLGEYGDLPEEQASRLQDVIIGILTNLDEDEDVRRRALESISNSSHEIVPEVIQEGYDSSNPKMKASAIFAMGKSCDPIWGEVILREVSSSDPELRYEAAKSAGELELDDAVPSLVRLALDDERDIKEVAIWSLGEIGGREARRVLSALAQDAEEDGDESLLEAIEDAIGNATPVGDDLELDDPA